MLCQFCEGEIGIAGFLFGDRDFCSPRHRARFFQSLRKGMNSLSRQPKPKPEAPGPLPGLEPICGQLQARPVPAFAYQPRTLKLPALEIAPRLDILADPQAFAPLPSSNAIHDKASELAVRLDSLRDRLERAAFRQGVLATA